MKEELIQRAYELAKERYAAIGVDVEKAMDALQKISLSLHCWQADDLSLIHILPRTGYLWLCRHVRQCFIIQ